MAVRGDWVLLHRVVLPRGERAPQVPEDTAQVPLECWVRGYLTKDAAPGEEAVVITLSGREQTGLLLEGRTGYSHSFGEPVPELMLVARQVKERLFGGQDG